MVYFSNLSFTKSESDARYAKLGAANRFLGVNTFNRPIAVGGNGLATKSGDSISVVELSNQNEKSMTFDFIQPTSGFRNYCNVFFRIKENNGNYQTGYKIQIKNNEAGLYFSTACNFYEYDNKEIKGVANPTTNTSVANKQYVDNRVRLIEKVGGFSFTRQVINNATGNLVVKYYGNMNYTTIGITNTSQIISCYLKSIPSQGQHLVITFFGEYNTDNLLVEIYQYGSNTDITTSLNNATFRIGYINS